MKKVGIITWHYLENYGSALQAYALQYIIKSFNYDVEFINYRSNANNSTSFKILRFIKYNLYYKKNSIKRRQLVFFQFRKKYLRESPLYISNDELKNKTLKYDIYVCGSDQIWASNRLDLPYLLDFVPNGKKRIAYAPSAVIDNFSSEQEQQLKRNITRFDHFSLREPYGVNIIKRITGIEGIDVLDPSLLLSESDYESLLVEPKIKKPFILCYLIGDNKKHREIVKEIKKIYGYDIVTLPFKEFDQYFGDVQIRDAGPCEFLGLVKNAEIICTDSFHGILFSIIFKKNFYTFKRFEETDMYNQNARVINIINKLNLKERIIENVKDIDITKIIDYEKVYEKLKTEKKKSIKFLKNALD